MMRQPTPMLRLLSWHRAYMRGAPAQHHDDPQCGWYKMRKVKGGVWVPVEIWCDREIDDNGELACDEILRADAFGEELDPDDIWLWVEPISRDEFMRLTEYRMQNQHRIQNETPIDLGSTPTPPRG